MEKGSDSVKIGGYAVALMEVEEGGERVFRENNLEKLLCERRVACLKLAVISVVGTIRKGKSFLMNLILRYLSSKCDPNWAANLDQEMEGFPWSCGLERHTTSIFMWSELFKMKIDDDDVMILLVDTQGLFGRYNSFEDNTTIAALSLLMSSFQILNIEYFLDATMSDFTEVFINYANMILDQWCINNPFQNIMGIVRDWMNPYDAPYGLQGGESFFKSDMSSKSSNSEHPHFKKYYKKLFNKIQCFLMPHPGMKASNNPNFDGRLRDLDQIFLEQLKILIPTIVCSENLSSKKINGHCLTCKEFYFYFKSLVRIINRRSFPKISDILTENGNINKWELFEKVNFNYVSEMDKFFESENEFITADRILNEHIKISGIIKENIGNTKIFNASVITEDLQKLISLRLTNLFQNLSSENSNKNIKMGIFTPYSLIFLLAMSYFISSIAQYSNIQTIIFCTEIVFYLSLSLIWLWIVACWYEVEELGAILDFISDILIMHNVSTIYRLRWLRCFLVIFIISVYFLSTFLIENGFILKKYKRNTFFNESEVSRQILILQSDFLRIIHSHLHNSHNLSQFINPTCKPSTKLVIGIHSSASNFIERHSIRNSWALLINEKVTQYFFIIGNSSKKSYHSYIETESRLFGDLIYISSIKESYLSLSNKTLSLMLWFRYYCQNAMGLFKTDDDVFVNVALLWKVLHSYSSVILSGPVIIGRLLKSPAVIRDRGKHCISKMDYPNDYYPDYVMGGGYFINHLAIEKIIRVYQKHIELHKTLFLWEDVTFTGILAKEAGVKLYNSFQMFSQLFDNLCWMSVIVVTHNVSPGQKVVIWKHFEKNEYFCTNVIQRILFIT